MVPIGDLASEKAMSDEIKEMPQVITVLSYVDKAGTDIPTEYIDEETLSKFMSKNYSRMVISVKTGFEGEETFNIVEKIREIATAYYPDENYVAGESVSTYDVKESVTEDMKRVNLIAIGAVFFVLLISFKSVILPFILVLAIETAVWINLSIPYYTGTTIFYMAYLIISSIQLGATVDYAILFTDRYVEFRAKYSKKTAVKKTISVVTGSVLTSGIIMAGLGFFLGGMTSHGVLSQLGYFLGAGGICSLIIVLFVLPGLLYLMDKPIQLATMKILFVNNKENECKATIGLKEVN